MSKIRGITVTLYTETSTEKDAFNRPIITETAVNVSNVLVYPTSASEVLDILNLTGRKAVYTLAIPKGDTHNWKIREFLSLAKHLELFGEPIKGIDDLIPLDWNTKVMVERYE